MEEHIDINGWKGKDKVEIYEEGDIYVLHQHRKVKETGEIRDDIAKVPKSNVAHLWAILDKFCQVGEIYGYRYIMAKIKEFYGFDVADDAWNGGVNRSAYYFPFQYYPLKILEAQGKIQYFGRGSIVRIL